MPTALIGPEPIRRQAGRYREILEAAGFSVVYPEGDGTLTEAQLRRLLPEADVLMAGGERLDAGLLDLAPRLKVIARTGVGFDAIDVPAATARGIAVTIAPGTNQESVAEQAFGLLLALTRKITHYDRIIRAGGWERTSVGPVRGKTLGLVGLGRIGRAMVPRALAFGMNVLAFDPVHDPEFDVTLGLQRLLFEELLGASDVVSLHLPRDRRDEGTHESRDLREDAPRLDPAEHRPRRPGRRGRPARRPRVGPPRRRGARRVRPRAPPALEPPPAASERRHQPARRRDRHQEHGRHGHPRRRVHGRGRPGGLAGRLHGQPRAGSGGR
jgi:hypothetical protein